MSKKKKNGKQKATERLLLAVAIIDLISNLIDLLNKIR